jgi:ribonucleoside-triphosphate reductase
MTQTSAAVLPLSPTVAFQQIRKRSGNLVPFEVQKITDAILKAARATGEFDRTEAGRLTIRVLSLAQATIDHEIPEVEEIQDLVEEVLLASSNRKTAKAYILYREQHALIRKMAQQADVKIIDLIWGGWTGRSMKTPT